MTDAFTPEASESGWCIVRRFSELAQERPVALRWAALDEQRYSFAYGAGDDPVMHLLFDARPSKLRLSAELVTAEGRWRIRPAGRASDIWVVVTATDEPAGGAVSLEQEAARFRYDRWLRFFATWPRAGALTFADGRSFRRGKERSGLRTTKAIWWNSTGETVLEGSDITSIGRMTPDILLIAGVQFFLTSRLIYQIRDQPFMS